MCGGKVCVSAEMALSEQQVMEEVRELDGTMRLCRD